MIVGNSLAPVALRERDILASTNQSTNTSTTQPAANGAVTVAAVPRNRLRSIIILFYAPLYVLFRSLPDTKPAAHQIHPVISHLITDSMEILLSHKSVRKDMGRKRPTIPCQRFKVRATDWSECEGTRELGVTARVPRRAAPGKARIGGSLPHAPASRSDSRCTLE